MQALAEIRSLLMSRVSNADQRRKILDMAKQYVRENHEVKDDYIMALLFPEYAPNVRIPSPFGLPSTLHTQKQEAYLTTNASGTGMLIFTLADLHWNLCYATSNVPSGSSGMGNMTIDGNNSTLYSPEIYAQRYLPNQFSHARVVGASVRISYIGQHDDEQGFMVGSHIQNQNICGITDRDIEEGYHVKRVRPSQGLRLAYTPFDEKDFQFTELNTRIVYDNIFKSSTAYYQNGFNTSMTPFNGYYNFRLEPNDLMYTYNRAGGLAEGNSNNPLQVQIRVIASVPNTIVPATDNGANFEKDNLPQGEGASTNQIAWVDIATTTSDGSTAGQTMAPLFHAANFLGLGPRAGNLTNQMPQIAAVYYKGLPPSSQCLRVDVIRHLECIPRSENKQYMTVERPQYCDSTQKLAAQLQHKQSNLQVTSLVEAPAVLAATSTLLMNTQTNDQVLDKLSYVDDGGQQLMIQNQDPGLWSSFYQSAKDTFMPLFGAGAGALAGGLATRSANGAYVGAMIGSAAMGGNPQLIQNPTTQQYSAPYTGGGAWGNGALALTM